jgi:hypothetical protein
VAKAATRLSSDMNGGLDALPADSVIQFDDLTINPQ